MGAARKPPDPPPPTEAMPPRDEVEHSVRNIVNLIMWVWSARSENEITGYKRHLANLEREVANLNVR